MLYDTVHVLIRIFFLYFSVSLNDRCSLDEGRSRPGRQLFHRVCEQRDVRGAGDHQRVLPPRRAGQGAPGRRQKRGQARHCQLHRHGERFPRPGRLFE